MGEVTNVITEVLMEKKRVTLTIRQDQHDCLEEMADDDDRRYSSKSEAARHLFDRVDELEDDVEELEREVERVKNEKQVLVEKHQETQQLEKYEEDVEELVEGGLGQRVKWLIFGKDS